MHRYKSISGMMLGIAILAFPIGVLASVLNGRPLLGLDYCLDTGLIPSVTALIALTPTAIKQRRSRSFNAGFVAAGWMAVIAYAWACRTFPDIMATPVVYYINEIEPRFMDADTIELYSVSLLVRGIIMAVPQLLVALAGGLLMRLATRTKQECRAT